ncbi:MULTISPECIES: hypothetical protein [unclassified Thiocapsa]|uniref:hypothetical protein n=1 Tax=unclassified Thiocapsa TaxID=2641286 RepID=UPI0035B25CAD
MLGSHLFRFIVERGEIVADQSVGRLYRDLEQMFTADEAEDDFAIQWRVGDRSPNDTFLICTGGLRDRLGQEALEALFRTERPLEAHAADFFSTKARVPRSRFAVPPSHRRWQGCHRGDH